MLFVSTDCLTSESSAINCEMAQVPSFARGLARFMIARVIWFELGMVAVLRAMIMGMRWVGWFMRVKQERLDDDLRFLESLGFLAILCISIKICAAIYSEMGRFLHNVIKS